MRKASGLVACALLLAACTESGPEADTSTASPSPSSAQALPEGVVDVQLIDQTLANHEIVAVATHARSLRSIIVVARGGYCGSIYAAPACYFFVRPKPKGAESSLVAQWGPRDVDGLLPESLRFEGRNRVVFRSKGGDAGCGLTRLWELDLRTGEVTELSRRNLTTPGVCE